MEQRRRIRDITHGGRRWIASVVAAQPPGAPWRGHLVFFLDETANAQTAEDELRFEALAFDEIVAQATALSPEEIHGRLARVLGESS